MATSEVTNDHTTSSVDIHGSICKANIMVNIINYIYSDKLQMKKINMFQPFVITYYDNESSIDLFLLLV